MWEQFIRTISHCLLYTRISLNGTLYALSIVIWEFLKMAHCILCLLFTRISIPGTMYAFRGCKDDLQTSVFGCWASLFALCCYWQVLKDNEKEKGAFIAYYSPPILHWWTTHSTRLLLRDFKRRWKFLQFFEKTSSLWTNQHKHNSITPCSRSSFAVGREKTKTWGWYQLKAMLFLPGVNAN